MYCFSTLVSLCETHSQICPSCTVSQPFHCGHTVLWDCHTGAVVYLCSPRHMQCPQQLLLTPAKFLPLQANRALCLLSPGSPKKSLSKGPPAVFGALMAGLLVWMIFTTGITHATVPQSWQVCDKKKKKKKVQKMFVSEKALDFEFCSFHHLCFSV